jgi:dienelactone hydrolase
MRTLAGFLLAAACAAQIPAADSRNTVIRHTDFVYPMPVFASLADWEAKAARLRQQILWSAGLLPMPEKSPLNPRIFGRLDRQGYTIEKVLLETFPGYYLAGNLYRPAGNSGRRHPGIVTPHGHWTYGRLEHSQHASIPARCVNLARQGYVVFSYDMVGYVDTVQTPHAFGWEKEHLLWNFGPLGLQLWNSIRAVDFLQTLPDVDPERIGATGASGGATQTFLLAAVDPRVKVTVPVNMISGIMQGGSPCENAPGLRFDTFNVELAALTAPRPMLAVAATGDWTRNNPTVEAPALAGLWNLYGKPDAFASVQFDAPHNYNKDSREAMYAFFAKHLLQQQIDTKERSFTLEPLPNMLVLHNRSLPPNALTFDQFFAQWRARSDAQAASATPAELRERLLLALGAEFPARVLAESGKGEILLTREGRGDRVKLIGSSRKSILEVHPDGDAGPAPAPDALRLVAFQTGSAKAPREQKRYFWGFNRSDDAARVQDILTALAWLKTSGSTAIELRCFAEAARWCAIAKAVAPFPVKHTALNFDFTSASDADLADRFFVPGLLRAGGWRGVMRLQN